MNLKKNKIGIFSISILFLLIFLSVFAIAAFAKEGASNSYSLIINKEFGENTPSTAYEQTYTFQITGEIVGRDTTTPINEQVEINKANNWTYTLNADAPIKATVTEITSGIEIKENGNSYNMGNTICSTEALLRGSKPQQLQLKNNGKITISRPASVKESNGDRKLTTTTYFHIYNSAYPGHDDVTTKLDDVFSLAPGGKPIVYDNLCAGIYTIEELKAPDGYSIQVGERTAEVDPEDDGHFYVNGNPGRLTLEAGGNKGDGATHYYTVDRVSAPSEDYVKFEPRTVSILSGETYTMDDLPKGNYTVKEHTYAGKSGYTLTVPQTEESKLITKYSSALNRGSDTTYKSFTLSNDVTYVQVADFGPLYNADGYQLTETDTYSMFRFGVTDEDGYISYKSYANKTPFQGNYYYTVTPPKQLVGSDKKIWFSARNVISSSAAIIRVRYKTYSEKEIKNTYDKAFETSITKTIDDRGWMLFSKASDSSAGAENLTYHYTITGDNNKQIENCKATDLSGNELNCIEKDGKTIKLSLKAGQDVKLSGLKAGTYLITESVNEDKPDGFTMQIVGCAVNVVESGKSYPITVHGERKLIISKPACAIDSSGDGGRDYTFKITSNASNTEFSTVKVKAGEKMELQLPEGDYQVTPIDEADPFQMTYTDSSSVNGMAEGAPATITFTNVFSTDIGSYRYIHEYYLKKGDYYTYEGSSEMTHVRGLSLNYFYQALDIIEEPMFAANGSEVHEYTHFSEDYGIVDTSHLTTQSIDDLLYEENPNGDDELNKDEQENENDFNENNQTDENESNDNDLTGSDESESDGDESDGNNPPDGEGPDDKEQSGGNESDGNEQTDGNEADNNNLPANDESNDNHLAGSNESNSNSQVGNDELIDNSQTENNKLIKNIQLNTNNSLLTNQSYRNTETNIAAFRTNKPIYVMQLNTNGQIDADSSGTDNPIDINESDTKDQIDTNDSNNKDQTGTTESDNKDQTDTDDSDSKDQTDTGEPDNKDQSEDDKSENGDLIGNDKLEDSDLTDENEPDNEILTGDDQPDNNDLTNEKQLINKSSYRLTKDNMEMSDNPQITYGDNGIIDAGYGNESENGMLTYKVNPNMQRAEVTKEGSNIIILRYFREVPEEEEGTYKVLHVYYFRDWQGDHLEGASEYEIHNGHIGHTYDANSNDLDGNAIQLIETPSESIVGGNYTYTHDGRPQYGVLTPDGSINDKITEVSTGGYTGNGYHCRPDTNWNSITATVNGEQVIILRYYREAKGSYKIVHEYYSREKNGDTATEGGTPDEGSEKEPEIDSSHKGKSQISVRSTPFNGTLSYDGHYTYQFDGAQIIETRQAKLDSIHKVKEDDQKPVFNSLNYTYHSTVYGETNSLDAYDQIIDKQWATATEDGSQIIILRYFIEKDDEIEIPEEPEEKPEKTPENPEQTPGTPPGEPEDPEPSQTPVVTPSASPSASPTATPENPGYPTELPDPNDPDSPDTITIWEDGEPRTYIKKWNGEEWVWILDEDVALSNAPDTGDDSNLSLWVFLTATSMICMGAFGFITIRKKKKTKS